jgi:histidinol-phosphate aminotransferase
VKPTDVLRPDVLAMSAYQVAAADGFVKLDAMENPYPLPESLRDGFARRLAGVALNRYPVPHYAALKASIRARFGVPDGCGLILGNGSDELISLLSVATARPGATVLSAWPSFVMYQASAQLAGSRFEGVPLAPGFALDRAAMLAAIERAAPAVVYLAYPNNPTGACFDDAVIRDILAAAPGLVVIDEAYQPFSPRTWMTQVPRHPGLLVMRTVSKLGLAGVRLGYMAGAPEWIEQLDKVRPPYNVNVLTEAAALFALEHHDTFEAQAAAIRVERAHLAHRLKRVPGIEVFPSDANFLLIRVSQAPAVWQALFERRVLVKDVGRMDPSLHDCLRITVGTPEENAALLAALDEALAQRAGQATA